MDLRWLCNFKYQLHRHFIRIFMHKEIFYLYIFKRKCPYSNPSIKTAAGTVCFTELFVSIDCTIVAFIFALFWRRWAKKGPWEITQNILFVPSKRYWPLVWVFDRYVYVITRVRQGLDVLVMVSHWYPLEFLLILFCSKLPCRSTEISGQHRHRNWLDIPDPEDG